MQSRRRRDNARAAAFASFLRVVGEVRHRSDASIDGARAAPQMKKSQDSMQARLRVDTGAVIQLLAVYDKLVALPARPEDMSVVSHGLGICSELLRLHFEGWTDVCSQSRVSTVTSTDAHSSASSR